MRSSFFTSNKGEWSDKHFVDPGPVREAEARKACGILRRVPRLPDKSSQVRLLTRTITINFTVSLRPKQPDVVFTQWPIDNHPDHRAVSLLTYEAWVRMGKKFPLYYYEVSNGEDTVQFAPTHYVDITATESRKREACYAHASQAPDRFYALQSMVTRMRGIESGHNQAESYIHHVQSPDGGLLNSPWKPVTSGRGPRRRFPCRCAHRRGGWQRRDETRRRGGRDRG